MLQICSDGKSFHYSNENGHTLYEAPHQPDEIL